MYTFKTIDGKEIKIRDVIAYNSRRGLAVAKVVGFVYKLDSYNNKTVSTMQVRRMNKYPDTKLAYSKTSLTTKAQCVILES